MARLVFAAVLAVVAGGGCALTATRPPTPAARLTGPELDQFPRSPDDRFFIIVFGSESFPKRPKYTHSWATVVRATGGTVVQHLPVAAGTGEQVVETVQRGGTDIGNPEQRDDDRPMRIRHGTNVRFAAGMTLVDSRGSRDDSSHESPTRFFVAERTAARTCAPGPEAPIGDDR